MEHSASKTQWWRKANEAYWSFPDDTIDSPKRLAALLAVLLERDLLASVVLRQFINRHLMPDIAMCHGDLCPVKEKCWRFLAPADRYQSYFAPPPFKEDGCEYFWDVTEDD